MKSENNIIINESDYEKLIIEKAKNLGWRYLDFYDVFELRFGELSEVILKKELVSFLQKSQNVSDNHLKKIIRKLKDLHGSSLYESNRLFCKYLIEGVKIYDNRSKKYITIKLHMQKFNRFVITNQFRMNSTHPDYKNQVLDIVLYLNGLPVGVIELKRPDHNDSSGIEKAFRQIENYKDYVKKIFDFNLFNIISDSDLSKVGSLTASFARYLNWRGEEFGGSLEKIFTDLLKHDVFIDVATNYTFYINENLKTNKIIAGYHQYYGVKKSIKSVLKAIETNKKGGVFWHTQGSGKSYSMIFLVKNLTRKLPQITFIVVTDRNNLDNQLFQNFNLASDYLGQRIHKISSIKELKAELFNHKQDGVFFTTIQKFTKDVGVLIKRDNIVVISDEAHRSHNNLDGKYVADVENQLYGKQFGSAKYLREAFPKGTFIGFTGTPIEKDDVSTTGIFGKLVSKYTMAEAENDGVVVGIDYESRKPELHLNEKQLQNLDITNDKIQETLRKKSSLPAEVRRKINREVKQLENIIGDSDRIKGICHDIMAHYQKRKNLVVGKAMIVTFNRRIALNYYKTITKLWPEMEDKIDLICTTNPQSDDKEIRTIAGTQSERDKKASEFKDPKSNFKIAIVVDMWLTGFDVPPLDTLYLDKPLKMHNLMQAIARTNRVYTDKEKRIDKESSLVVDYIGIWNKLSDALAFYSSKKKQEINAQQNLENYKYEAISKLNLTYDNYEISNLKIDFGNCISDKSYAFNVVEKIVDLILRKKTQKEFVDVSRAFAKILKKIISVINETDRVKFALLLSARQKLIKLALDDIDFISIKKELLLGMDKSIDYTKTTVINNLQNRKISLKDLREFLNLSLEGENEVDLNTKKSVVVLKALIKELKKISLERASKLSMDLKKLLDKYDKNFISMKELRKGLKHIKLESYKHLDEQQNDGLSNEERNFYEILEKPIAQTNYDRSKIKMILEELLEIMSNDDFVSKQWVFNTLLKRKTRNKLRSLLKKHNYPPKEIENTRDRVVEAIIINKEIN